MGHSVSRGFPDKSQVRCLVGSMLLCSATRNKRKGDVALFIHPEQEKIGTSFYHPTRNMPPGTIGNGDVALFSRPEHATQNKKKWGRRLILSTRNKRKGGSHFIIPPGTCHPEQPEMETSPYSSTRNKRQWGRHLILPPGTRERG